MTEEYKHINDDPHDGWWLRPEHQDSEDEDQRQESNWTTKEISTNEEHNFEISQNEEFEKNADQLLNEETTKEITTKSEIEVPKIFHCYII